jgi:hypothetical protein
LRQAAFRPRLALAREVRGGRLPIGNKSGEYHDQKSRRKKGRVIMIAKAELQEYEAEIRRHVCSRCVERPAGGPPCAPLGKRCGVEMHLPQLVASIHEVHSDLAGPYIEHNRQEICAHCALLHSSICPCPMDYLGVLLIEAVESVDRRRAERGQAPPPRPIVDADVQAIAKAYQEAVGTWTGCDWTTTHGKSCLDLNGWRAAQAEAMALETTDPQKAADWMSAARWLAKVEQAAREAEAEAGTAVVAAEAGEWRTALAAAERAWALEFSTGRPIWHSYPGAWQDFRRVVVSAYAAHRVPMAVR